MRALFGILALTLSCVACDEPTPERPAPEAFDWRKDVIYFAMTDRFYNGNPANDTAGEINCFDENDPKLFHGGDFAGISQNTPYFDELGITTLWISPVTEQVPRVGDACGYHGYWPDYSNPDNGYVELTFGEPFELDEVISTMPRTILDLVLNHAGYGASITLTNPNYFHTQAECEAALDPDVICPIFSLPDFAQEKPVVARYLTDLARAWFLDFDFSGVRVDAAKHIPLAFLRDDFVPAIRGVNPNAFLLAEVLGDEGYGELLPYLDAGFDSVFNVPLRYALVESIAQGGSTDVIATRMNEAVTTLGQERTTFLVTFLGNHDLPRFASEISFELPSAARKQRYILGLLMLFTLPGIPQLTWGDELGMEGYDEAERRRDMPTWAFSPARRVGDKPGFIANVGDIFSLTQKLIALRQTREVLQRGEYVELWRPNGGADVFVFARTLGSELSIIAVNNSDAEQTVDVPIAANTNLSEAARATSGTRTDSLQRGAPSTVTIEGGVMQLTLPARTGAIY